MGDLATHLSYNNYFVPRCDDGRAVPPSLGSLGSVPHGVLGRAAQVRSVERFLLPHAFILLWPLTIGGTDIFPVPRPDALSAPFSQPPFPPMYFLLLL